MVLTLLMLLCLGLTTSQPSDADMKTAARQQAESCVQAWARGDFDAFASKIYPKVLDTLGGKDGMVRMLQASDKEMKSQGMAIRSITIGKVVQLRESNSEEFAIVPESLEITVPGGVLRTQGYLFGISDDGGRMWSFIDGAGIEKIGNKIFAMMPNLPADFEFPKAKAPVFVAATGEGATQPSTRPTAMEIERADYKIRVPGGSTVDPAEPDIDLDHQTTVHFRNGVTLIIMVLDDRAMGDDIFKVMADKYKSLFNDAKEKPSDVFTGRNGKATVVEGLMHGIRMYAETGLFSGKQKAFVMSWVGSESHSVETRRVLRRVVESFVVKE